MGEFLSTPIKEKVSDDGENSMVSNNLKIFLSYIINIVKIRFM